MNKRSLLTMVLVIFLAGILSVSFGVREVKASGPIYINGDGSVSPSSAPIQRSGNLYTFSGNVYGSSIFVVKNDVVIDGAGYTVEGTGNGTGIYLFQVRNVTIKNLTIRGFKTGIGVSPNSSNINISGNSVANNTEFGIHVDSQTSGSSIVDNTVTANSQYGIWLFSSSNTVISGNSMTANGYCSIYLSKSSNTVISGNFVTATANYGSVVLDNSSYNSLLENNITGNLLEGVILMHSSNNFISQNRMIANNDGLRILGSSSNTILGNELSGNNFTGISMMTDSNNNEISGNNITGNQAEGLRLYRSSNNLLRTNIIVNNTYGIWAEECSNNTIYHNDFVDNLFHVSTVNSQDTWDNGYPGGGNYWSLSYTIFDQKSGPNQDQPGSDDIADSPYIIDLNNRDRYPLMEMFVIPEFPSVLILPLFAAATLLAASLLRKQRKTQRYPEGFG